MNRKKKIVIAVLAVFAPVILGSGIYYTYLITPPPMPETFDQAAAMMGSARFERLPDYRKAEFAAVARRLFAQLPEEYQYEVKKSGDKTLHKRLLEMYQRAKVERYRKFSQASPEEKIRMLDEKIDDQAATLQKPRREKARFAKAPSEPKQNDAKRQGQVGRRKVAEGARPIVRRMVQQDNPQTGTFGLDAEYRRAVPTENSVRAASPVMYVLR